MTISLTQLKRALTRSSTSMHALLCLLVLGLSWASVPTTSWHAHADGDHAHTHAEPANLDSTQQPNEGGLATLHAHDTTPVNHALPQPSPWLVATLGFDQLHFPDGTTSVRLGFRPPPHRPPIA